jgi:hypothetical protein
MPAEHLQVDDQARRIGLSVDDTLAFARATLFCGTRPQCELCEIGE